MVKVIGLSILLIQFVSSSFGKENNHNFFSKTESVLLPNVTHFVETALKTYDKYHMPPWSKGEPVQLQCGFYVESLSEFTETAMTFHVDMYLRLRWADERLAHNGPLHFVFNEPRIIEKLWLPDIYISNAPKTNFHLVTQPNQLLRILPNGNVQYSVYVWVQWLQIKWLDHNAVETNSLITLPEMKLLDIKPEYCNGTYVFGNMTNVFSCLQASIRVQRQIGFHIIQTYVPSSLIVIVSWTSFWIDPAAVPARTGLCITTLLTITTQAAGIRASLPPVSYAKAIDFWIGICTFMIFGTLLEYVVVNSIMRKASAPHIHVAEEKVRRRLTKSSSRKIGDSNTSDFELKMSEELKKTKKDYFIRANCIESISKIVFPISFIVFNIVYWITFL